MTIKTQFSLYTILFLFVFVGCKSAKTIVANGELNNRLTAKQLIKQTEKVESDFKTLVGKMKIEYIEKNKSEGTTVSLRIEKDKTIWMSKLGLVKALITPTRVAFYNKLDNTYFDGDFTYLSNLLGTELDFQKVQNMLLGQSMFALNDKDYEIDTFDQSYQLKPKKQRDLFELFLMFNPSHFKMDSQQIAQPKERRILQIDYLSYQKVDNLLLPSETKIFAIENEDQLVINLELKSVDLNEDVRFPFSIPSGYKKIEL